jgi:hypothetical protein
MIKRKYMCKIIFILILHIIWIIYASIDVIETKYSLKSIVILVVGLASLITILYKQLTKNRDPLKKTVGEK